MSSSVKGNNIVPILIEDSQFEKDVFSFSLKFCAVTNVFKTDLFISFQT